MLIILKMSLMLKGNSDCDGGHTIWSDQALSVDASLTFRRSVTLVRTKV